MDVAYETPPPAAANWFTNAPDSDGCHRSLTSLMAPHNILIVGAGIAGIACALSLAKELTPFVPDLQITIFERHDVLSTSGGAINLTPVAQRHLDRLGVLDELNRLGSEGGADVDAIELYSTRSGKSLGSIDFTDHHGNGFGGYKGRRVMRIILSLAMLAVVERTKNVHLAFGKKLVRVDESADHATLHFADGSSATGDLVLGCDGVHSATRSQFVAPDNPSEYTGISFVQTVIDADALDAPVHFAATSMNVSRYGSLLASYCDRDRSQIFLSAIVQFPENRLSEYRLDNAQEWRTKSAIKSALRDEMRQRFGRSGIPCVREMTSTPADWMLYPVYQVRPGGRWHTERVLLLGDAAHAVCTRPPAPNKHHVMEKLLTMIDAPPRRIRRIRPRRRDPLLPHPRQTPPRASPRRLQGVRGPPPRHRYLGVQGVAPHVGEEPRPGVPREPAEGVDAAVLPPQFARGARGRVGV
jgi:2-polyprenyl-6-methoxyphenol hydroxylase-like FAD-dependent oxidoreductase